MGLLPKRKKKRQELHDEGDAAAFWGEQAVEEEQRLATEDSLKAARKAKWWRRGIITIVFVLFPATLLALLNVFTILTSKEEEADGYDLAAPGRVEATIAMQSWLTQTPAPLPGAKLITWDGAKAVDYPQDEKHPAFTEATRETVWEHSFTLEVPPTVGVAGKRGTPERLFQAQLLTVSSEAQGHRVFSDPAVLPLPLTQTLPVSLGYWPGVEIKQADGDVVEAINKWAAAYVGSDPAALKLATGDPDKNHVYIPLGGLKAVGVEISRSGVILEGDGLSNEMIAEVELSLDRKEVNERGQQYMSLPATKMDVLVKDWNTGSPTVTAWGAAGAGHLLTAYENAAPATRLQEGTDLTEADPKQVKTVETE